MKNNLKVLILIFAFAVGGTAFTWGAPAKEGGHSPAPQAHSEAESEGHGEGESHHEGESGHHQEAHEEIIETHHGHADHGDHGDHAEHAEHHEEHPPEIPDLLLILGGHHDTGSPISKIVNIGGGAGRVVINSLVIALIIFFLFKKWATRLDLIPTRPSQSVIEFYVELIDNFVCDILGKEMGRRYVPFIGTLAIYIWVMNLAALVPGFMSPTTYLQQTFALSITVFLYVQWTAVRENGPLGYVYHLMGEPRDLIGWSLVPLFLPLHILGEFVKPVSLALRLRGNILGEHILLGVFSGLGVLLVQYLINYSAPWLPGLPLHILLLPIALLGSTIQALVFVTLSTIYFLLVMPHEEHEHEHGGEGGHQAPAAAH